ncbi:DNA/RNA non-specific endonuclease [Listeria valentina]|uniref:DNA/RNA non-specific endonuclease n=1 Tax=Listeria valentina TaxID=2705293 RepID=UPI001431E2C8|nr:DNA/RNA non-specific endonuclease [Listeria valentina]
MKKVIFWLLFFFLCLAGMGNYGYHQWFTQKEPEAPSSRSVQAQSTKELADLEFDGMHQVIQLHHNQPQFSDKELQKGQKAYQSFSHLDRWNRVGVANALLDRSMMPQTEREPLTVDPTGWHNKKVTVQGKSNWLYNRCHLIGYQLTGENNNLKNLMTGTRSLNTPYMLHYENQVAEYVKETGNQVRYRVTPIFRGEEKLARGIQLEAQSIQYQGLSFNVYIFNVQKGILLHYEDGTSELRK